MKIDRTLFQDYENTKLFHYDDKDSCLNWVDYDDLSNYDNLGVLKASKYVDGKLKQLYTEQGNHVGVIAATRMGKTTSYVMPFVISNAQKKDKPGMIISDPKGEVYKMTSAYLRKAGYRVLLLNFRDYMHSESWNMLTPIYRKYHQAYAIYDEVGVVDTDEGPKNIFRGKIYDNQAELDRDLGQIFRINKESVSNEIDTLAAMMITTNKKDDPYWEDGARDILKAFIWAMLEDSREEDLEARGDCDFEKKLITEDTFSFSTMLNILAKFHDEKESNYNDGGYFANRDHNCKSYLYAKNSFLENAPITRKCMMSTFNVKISVFRDAAMRVITSCNSFELEDLTDGPVAVFIDYRDEVKVHYQMISNFVQSAYLQLINTANEKLSGRLDVPFYFVLDEFGNFPYMNDFETIISACGGRNIFFVLIMQSYAQLNSVYGDGVAEIIRDNLNVHVFFGSNNPNTLEEFSKECGITTRISPLSALNGSEEHMSNYQKEEIAVMPKSRLSHLEPGECIVTEANSGYVLWSKLERYYNCKEFTCEGITSMKDYQSAINPFDEKYIYELKEIEKRRNNDWSFLRR
jgi:type IV secretion system protein VirD4